MAYAAGLVVTEDAEGSGNWEGAFTRLSLDY